jgi:hypothetical protein
MKKKSDYLDSYKRIRQIWEINPRERVKESKKKKSRKKQKQDDKRMLKDEENY